jgi:prepilin-type N-terminal cleavage/methylation domain-containing protein
MVNKQKGFTLIELLVVIAIIGILASVVLASLNSARAKGADAAIKSNLANIRAQAELYYDDPAKGNGTYGTTVSACTTAGGMFLVDPVIAAAIVQITTQSGGTPACSTSADAQKWAISSSLKTTGLTWCVDNNGWAKAGTAAAGICS